MEEAGVYCARLLPQMIDVDRRPISRLASRYRTRPKIPLRLGVGCPLSYRRAKSQNLHWGVLARGFFWCRLTT